MSDGWLRCNTRACSGQLVSTQASCLAFMQDLSEHFDGIFQALPRSCHLLFARESEASRGELLRTQTRRLSRGDRRFQLVDAARRLRRLLETLARQSLFLLNTLALQSLQLFQALAFEGLLFFHALEFGGLQLLLALALKRRQLLQTLALQGLQLLGERRLGGAHGVVVVQSCCLRALDRRGQRRHLSLLGLGDHVPYQFRLLPFHAQHCQRLLEPVFILQLR
mmetsp:Transcript_33690/g.93036  ORF Transcript_33690/g.93036 Transcript_33690/m.93036 type:complete len:223 (-) Transcript_33690:1903-2571(-)